MSKEAANPSPADGVRYDIIIGLEVHAQLKTRTKIFCGCATTFGQAPNSQVCPVCAGLPGVLPVLNREVFELGLRAVLALGGTVAPRIKFDRKNYFYPDLPKGYQISQFDKPIGSGGGVKIIMPEGEKYIELTRLHLEEDAGKLIHDLDATGSLVDLNRAGVPLAEIVSEPVIKSPDEAYAYLTNLKAILKAAGISDADMEKGQLRCDANISLRKTEQDPFGAKIEVKNVNSFKNVKAALEFEIQRQAKALDSGETLTQETRLYDAVTGRTMSMRSKEQAHDYRYFPEPDLVPFEVDAAWIKRIQESMPELPEAKRARFKDQYALSDYDIQILMQDDVLTKFFEAAADECKNYKTLANWVMGPVAAYLNENALEAGVLHESKKGLLELLVLVDEGKVSFKAAKEDVYIDMMQTGKSPEVILNEKGLGQISDTGALESVVNEVVSKNPKSVEDYKSGKTNALMFLVGQVMKGTKGKANPPMVKEILEKKLS